jgi:hypothetical protein
MQALKDSPAYGARNVQTVVSAIMKFPRLEGVAIT